MKKHLASRQNNSARASTLQITLALALLSVSAIFFAPSVKATASGTMITVPQTTITVSLPIDTLSTSLPINSVIIELVSTTPIDSSLLLVAFKGVFYYDGTVVDFAPPFVRAAGLTTTNWQFSANLVPAPEQGPTIRALHLSAFSNNLTPLSGSGTLFELTMVRTSSVPGDLSLLTWAEPPDNFYFIDVFGNPYRPTPTTHTNQPNGLITIAAATPTPTPGTVSISGHVSYCSSLALPPVADVTLNLTPGTPAMSDGSGYYEFSSLPAGSYDLTPSKADLTPGSAGINTVDVVAAQKHFLTIAPLPVGCRRDAADVSGNGVVNTVDVIAIERFFLGQTFGTAKVGKYEFRPTSYLGISSSQEMNFDTLVFGDVASGFVHRPEGSHEGD